MSNTNLPFSVNDRKGFGWGRYASKQEAEQRRDELRAMRDSVLYPLDPSAQFDVAKTL